MKKIMTLGLIGVIAITLLSSCGSKNMVTIAKRHYNNGYYVSYGKGKVNTHSSIERENLGQVKAGEPTCSIEANADSFGGYSNQSIITDNNTVAASEEKVINKTVSHLSRNQNLKQKTKIIQLQLAKIKHLLSETKNVKKDNDSSDGRGLGLFWEVALVLLVLWALGFLAFHLGWLIHLLLVIALILFILWLLGIG